MRQTTTIGMPQSEQAVASLTTSQSRRGLEAQKLVLQSVLDSVTEGLAVVDEQGKFLIWNTAAEKFLA